MVAPFESLLALALTALGAGAVMTAVLARLAPALELLDAPDGRKDHAHPVPVVGGLAIFASAWGTIALHGVAPEAAYLFAALSLVIAVGLWDDAVCIAPWVKLAIQVLASLVMVAGAGVILRTVGDLIGWRPIGLAALAVPMTVFATVGVINSFNMIDGLDGLCGSLALVAFGWYAAAAAAGGQPALLPAALAFCGATAGFLMFNLRTPWQPRARAFLGDAGSLMLGFALAWLAIDLTQRGGGAFYPIAALWVVLVPLADCVSVMARRLERGQNPFVADRRHIHHYLLRRGLAPHRVLAILVAISTLCGAVGFFGWYLRAPESVLFWPFFFGFFAYHRWIKGAWTRLEAHPQPGPEPDRASSGEERPARASA